MNRSRIYVVVMLDEHSGYVLCAQKLCSRLSEARATLQEIREHWPDSKFKIIAFEPIA